MCPPRIKELHPVLSNIKNQWCKTNKLVPVWFIQGYHVVGLIPLRIQGVQFQETLYPLNRMQDNCFIQIIYKFHA